MSAGRIIYPPMSGRDRRHFSRELHKGEQEHARLVREAEAAYAARWAQRQQRRRVARSWGWEIRMKITGFVICFLAIISSANAGSFSQIQVHGTPASASYTGPCDLVTCAEAYSVARAMTTNYSGPLFQLYNGTTTKDVGQTTSHAADLTGVSSFCGGIPGTCVYGKIYAQVQGSHNDLIASTINTPFGPNCTASTYVCAAPFAIEAATGLPIVNTGTNQEYALASDQNSIGITSTGSASMSITYNGASVTTPMCCGIFGITHQANAGNTTGTDFGIVLSYSNTGLAPCGTSTTYCVGIDEELAGDSGDYGSSPINLVGIITYNRPTNTVTGAVNNHSIFSISPPNSPTLNSGIAVHFGGGGDLSQPAPATMREVLVTNTAMTSGQQSSVYSNVTSFFSQISYP